jgi:hypothetical protein
MNETLAIDQLVHDTACELAGAPVLSLRAATSGANSRIYRVDTTIGPFALKSYPTRANDTRSRADVEWQTLQFLSTRGVTSVPKPLARDAAGKFMLMEWIDGAPIESHLPADVLEAAQFIVKIFDLSADPEAALFPLASEACLSAAAIIQQIEERLPLFVSDPQLDRFLAETFVPLLSVAVDKLGNEHQRTHLLAPELRRLIPADFGFHNAVRHNGGCRYVDFEYFGWDDPVKITADFILHPAMQLSADDNRKFYGLIRAGLQNDLDFSARFERELPLFALRWILILFNPLRRDRVTEVPTGEHARRALLENRLDKARKLLPWTERGAAAARIGL